MKGYRIDIFSEFYHYEDKSAIMLMILDLLRQRSKSGDAMFRNININADLDAGLARIEFSGLWGWERESARIKITPNLGVNGVKIAIEPIMDKETAWAIVDILRSSSDGHLWKVSAESVIFF